MFWYYSQVICITNIVSAAVKTLLPARQAKFRTPQNVTRHWPITAVLLHMRVGVTQQLTWSDLTLRVISLISCNLTSGGVRQTVPPLKQL